MSSSPVARLLRETPVVVTGMGCVCAAGHSVDAVWQAALAGRGTAAWHEIGAGPGSGRFVACHAGRLEIRAPGMRWMRKSDRIAQLAWLAARQAFEQAHLDEVQPATRVGVVAGSSRGPLTRLADSFALLGKGRLPASLAVDTAFASLSGTLGQGLVLLGPGATVSAACASAAVAIGYAAEQILLGNADAMLVGGAEAPLHPAVFGHLSSAGVLGRHEQPEQSCRPFDATRNGFVPGEGSAFLVLESASHAAGRGRQALARLRGWATLLDRSGRAGMRHGGSGLLTVMRQAMGLAEIGIDQIDYVNAHGTGTRQGDRAEAQAVATLFGKGKACSSTKPVTGHCMGATAALEAVIAIQALHHQMVPPTAHCTHPDPDCPIDPRPGMARPAGIMAVLSNSAGFWGCQASLIFSR